MFSFTFDPLAAIFGISGIVGFYFFVSAAKGSSSINTKPKKELDQNFFIQKLNSNFEASFFSRFKKIIIQIDFKNKNINTYQRSIRAKEKSF